MAEANYINALRRGIEVTPAAYGDAAVRQRFYRRGGTLNNNWYYVGENASDGGVFTDTLSDAEIEAAGTVPTDFFKAVPSVDADGNAVLAQPVPYVWGPVNDMVFAAGDPNRPGSVYFCYPGEVDKWGADNYVDVCAPGEAIQNGFVYAGQSFAWSSQRLYAITPNLIDALTITPSPTSCTKAPAGPWAFTVGPSAVYFLANDGVYVTTGGEAINLSDEWLKPLFQGQTSNGLLPIDFTATADMRLAVWRNDVWVQYKDSGGTTRFLLYNLLDQSWRHYSFGVGTKTIYADVTPGVQRLLMGGSTTGDAYTYTGTSDDGANIAVAVRHPVLNQGQDIANKLYSDLTVDADRQSTTLTVTPYLSNETTAATALTINSGSGRQRYTYNFNPQPTSSQNVAYDIAWSSAANTPRVYGLQTSYVVDPAAAQHKGIDWEDLGDTYYTGLDLDIDTGNLAKTCNVYVDQTLVATTTVQTNGRRLFHITLGPARGHLYRYDFSDSNPARIWGHKWHVEVEPSEQTNWNQNFTPLDGLSNKYLKGVALDCDTFGVAKTVQLQADGGVITTITVNQNGRGIQHFGFPATQGRLVRILPVDSNPGRLYSATWIYDDQPFSLTAWDSNWDNLGDSYYTGINIEINTFNVAKTFSFAVDGTTISTQSVTTNGRQVVKLSFTPARGSTFRFFSTDTTVAQLFSYQWQVDKEPSTQANWNQNYTPLDGLANKYIKGVALDCDTFGATKTIQVQGDGAVLTTLSVTQNGRGIQHFGFPASQARLLRLLPTDTNQGRLYAAHWIYDDQPFVLTVWDSNWENKGDTYYTGLNIEVDTFGVDKVFNFYVDQTLIDSQTINANGRTLVHITLPPGRGHLYRWTSTDSVVAQVYGHQWMLDAEPSEQANWNQNFTISGTLADKAVKGVLLECDTFGEDKSVEIQIDGTTHTTLTVNTDGRKVVQFSFAQGIGRVLRLLPVDDHPGRLYSIQWIFDTEPLKLDRWETQPITHGIPTWQIPVEAQLTLKSTALVVLTLTTYLQSSTTITKTYYIPSTAGEKRKLFVPFEATKGVMFKYLFTSAEPFYLFREESSVRVQPWGSQAPVTVHPFGNDDLDPSRGMGVASLQAATPGGSAT